MADFQSISLRRACARAERKLADDHERLGQTEAARNCRERARAYDERADRDEVRTQFEAHR